VHLDIIAADTVYSLLTLNTWLEGAKGYKANENKNQNKEIKHHRGYENRPKYSKSNALRLST